MGRVVRLVTLVDVDDATAGPRQISVLARHEAELDDGHRMLLSDDRGWSGSGPPDAWGEQSVHDVVLSERLLGRLGRDSRR
jgi:hypothetical protein